ncbi:glycerophosphodiester phosphodiesterase [Spirosoma sp. KCTC 42546]|uniref:glycerophosphodiester phosphodiesterase n=1 Tax=Spirosoma sp. KCTC 42546 TaxID=2520506 RepID=UPI001158A9FA|nr:glycerophosphodiester phosphodiesterase family protein [Spirosoma sp. KCTC 42546]QDK79625.1 glycerophosphodiester phosphodiesterase [Spirosoma sp. KCTC 42546]
MNKTLLFVINLIFAAFSGAAVSMAQSALSLTNYTYSPTQLVIGTIQSKESVARFTLRGPNAALFSVNKDNQLAIKSAATKSSTQWYDLIIEGRGEKGTQRDTFRLVNDQFIRNQVIAHRGAWKQSGTTENSLTSLNNAVKLGCMGSEFDVHMSSDSVLFIHHDPTIEGIEIEKTPASELAKLKLSNGEALPTLDAYLREGMKQNRTRLILEIKTSKLGRSMALTERVVAMVHHLKAQAWVEYIAFDYDVCKKVKALDPVAKVSYLNGDKSPAQLEADRLNGFDYHFSVLKKNEAWLQDAKQRHLTTNAWTVNDQPTLQWFLDQHVDYITTNEPELLLKLVSR